MDVPQGGLPVAGFFALLALPGFVIKQTCNVEQFRASCQRLFQIDLDKNLQHQDAGKGKSK